MVYVVFCGACDQYFALRDSGQLEAHIAKKRKTDGGKDRRSPTEASSCAW